jgi:hypothetical protein
MKGSLLKATGSGPGHESPAVITSGRDSMAAVGRDRAALPGNPAPLSDKEYSAQSKNFPAYCSANFPGSPLHTCAPETWQLARVNDK